MAQLERGLGSVDRPSTHGAQMGDRDGGCQMAALVHNRMQLQWQCVALQHAMHECSWTSVKRSSRILRLFSRRMARGMAASSCALRLQQSRMWIASVRVALQLEYLNKCAVQTSLIVHVAVNLSLQIKIHIKFVTRDGGKHCAPRGCAKRGNRWPKSSDSGE